MFKTQAVLGTFLASIFLHCDPLCNLVFSLYISFSNRSYVFSGKEYSLGCATYWVHMKDLLGLENLDC